MHSDVGQPDDARLVEIDRLVGKSIRLFGTGTGGRAATDPGRDRRSLFAPPLFLRDLLIPAPVPVVPISPVGMMRRKEPVLCMRPKS